MSAPLQIPQPIPDPVFQAFLAERFPQVLDHIGRLWPHLAAQVTGTLNCSRNNDAEPLIADLSGLEYFTGLGAIDCSYQAIDILPALPPGLQELHCAHNNLSFLPPLPPGLRVLEAYENRLAALPPLPDTVEYMALTSNPLTELPPLPAALQRLEVEDCLLTALPPLPAGLQMLSCGGNRLSSLPTLPAGLQTLVWHLNPGYSQPGNMLNFTR